MRQGLVQVEREGRERDGRRGREQGAGGRKGRVRVGFGLGEGWDRGWDWELWKGLGCCQFGCQGWLIPKRGRRRGSRRDRARAIGDQEMGLVTVLLPLREGSLKFWIRDGNEFE